MLRPVDLLKAALLALPVCGYALILRLPQAGELGLALRYQFDPSLLVVGGLLWLALLPRGRLGFVTGLAATLVLFALPLNGLWSSAAGEMHVLGGLLYFSDTAGYYWDASRLLEGGLFSAFAARRPLFPGLLAGLLGLANHDLQLVLAALVGLCGLASALAARELRRTHGAAAGALFLLLLFLFYRRFIGMTDTENLGLILGALAFALLWRGAWQARRLELLTGALLLALALAARAGAFLVLPALVAWGAWRGRGLLLPARGGRMMEIATAGLMISAAVGLGLALNLLVYRVTGDGQGRPFGNFAHTLYGMAAGGKGWEQVYQDLPAVASLPESLAAREIYREAWGMIRRNPGRFGLAILGQFAGFFSLQDASAFGFAGGADLVIFDAPRPENAPLYRAVRLLLGGLSLVGLLAALRRRDALHSLLLCLAAGMVLSVAFLPPRDAGLMRVYAATLPLLAAVPAVGLAALIGWVRKRSNEAPDPSLETGAGTGRALLATGLGLALLVILAPLAVRVLVRAPSLPAEASCLPGEQSMTVRISPGAYLRVVADGAAPRTWLPEVRQSDYLAGLQTFPHRAELPGLENISPPVLMQNAIDLETGQAFWLVLQDGPGVSGLAGDRPVVVTLCGAWNADLRRRNFDFFFALIPQG